MGSKVLLLDAMGPVEKESNTVFTVAVYFPFSSQNPVSAKLITYSSKLTRRFKKKKAY
jgi:hypothetical protein